MPGGPSDLGDDRLRHFQVELREDLKEIREEFKAGLNELRTHLNTLPIVRQDVYEANREADALARLALEERIKSKADQISHEDGVRRISALENFNAWLLRVVVGSVITGAMGIVFTLAR